jgi:hypothetical protein
MYEYIKLLLTDRTETYLTIFWGVEKWINIRTSEKQALMRVVCSSHVSCQASADVEADPMVSVRLDLANLKRNELSHGYVVRQLV